MIKIILLIFLLIIIFYFINNQISHYEKFINKKDNIVIILTSTVNVQNKSFLFQTDKEERLKQYLKTIKRWLYETDLKIVLVENSGYKYYELNDELKRFKNRFEIITYNEADEPSAKYLKNIRSKGASELFSINYANDKSLLLNNATFIIKITGRYFIPELEEYLSNFDLSEYDGLIQNNPNRCEIVGSHINNFNNIFNINLLDENNRYRDHVEAVFKYRLSLFKNIIRCKEFSIEPTQRGGKNEIFTIL